MGEAGPERAPGVPTPPGAGWQMNFRARPGASCPGYRSMTQCGPPRGGCGQRRQPGVSDPPATVFACKANKGGSGGGGRNGSRGERGGGRRKGKRGGRWGGGGGGGV